MRARPVIWPALVCAVLAACPQPASAQTSDQAQAIQRADRAAAQGARRPHRRSRIATGRAPRRGARGDRGSCASSRALGSCDSSKARGSCAIRPARNSGDTSANSGGRGARAGPARASRAATSASSATRAGAGAHQRRRPCQLEGLQPRHGGGGQLPRRRRTQRRQPEPRVDDGRVRSLVPGRGRSLRARRFLPGVRRGRRGPRRRLRDLLGAAGQAAREGGEDARRVRQGERDAHPRAVVGRPAAHDRQPARRRRRHQRRGRVGGATDSGRHVVPRGDRPGVPRRFGRLALPVEHARRPELRGPPARVSRSHRVVATSTSARRSRADTTPQASSTASTWGGSRPRSTAPT